MILLRFAAITAFFIAYLIACGPAGITPETAPESTSSKPPDLEYSIVEADQGYRLTMSQLAFKLSESGLFSEGGEISADTIRVILDSVVSDTLAGLAAWEIALGDYYEFHRQYRQRYEDALLENYFDQMVYSQIEMDSQNVVDYYQDHPDLFGMDEQVYIYHIQVTKDPMINGPDSVRYRELPVEELEAAVEKRARDIRAMINSPESFKTVAAEYSDDTTRADEGGLIGWAERGTYLKPFDSVSFALKPGEVSQPYKDSYGWHIILVEDYKEAGIPPLDSARYQRAAAHYRALQANRIGGVIMDTLLDEIDVEYNDSILDSNLYYVDVQQWVAIVNGMDTIDCNDARGPELAARRNYQVANTNAEQKKEMLQRLAQRMTIIQAARAIRIDTLAGVAEFERFLWHKYAKAIYRKAREDVDWLPDDSSVQRYYQEHAAEFRPQKPMKVQHIIVSDSLFGDFLRDQAMSGYDFLDLAEEHYPGDTLVRRKLADLGRISQRDVPEAFWKAAQQTVLGEVSHPVKTEYGYHIIKVLEREEVKSIEQVRPGIVSKLKKAHQLEVFREYRDKLYRKYHVKFTGEVVPVYLRPLTERFDTE
ncbi:MAG: peptidylprolyl isomerase [Candidatus Zixiibacteriota bacterium]|nr:MAG: peptidylprolyl isomerase [candidate division Zixibacteria bacterium]